MPSAEDGSEDATHNQVRPKPEQYADRTWMPPRGTRRRWVNAKKKASQFMIGFLILFKGCCIVNSPRQFNKVIFINII
jgi:hypothetical protein